MDMVGYRLKDILSEINGTNWYWNYSLEHDIRRATGRVIDFNFHLSYSLMRFYLCRLYRVNEEGIPLFLIYYLL